MRMDRTGDYARAIATALPFATVGVIIAASMSWDAQPLSSHMATTVPKVENLSPDKTPVCVTNLAQLALGVDCSLELLTETAEP
jgi:hypothetical protein